MVCLGRELRYQTDYIQGTDRRLFGNVSIWDPRHNSDHYMILGCLHITNLRGYTKYLGGHTRLPLWPPTTLTREDSIFADLHWEIPKPKVQESQKNVWISVDTWSLIDTRVSARKDPVSNQGLIWRLSHEIKSKLEGRQRQGVRGSWQQYKVTPEPIPHPLQKESCSRTKEWYKAAYDPVPPPS